MFLIAIYDKRFEHNKILQSANLAGLLEKAKTYILQYEIAVDTKTKETIESAKSIPHLMLICEERYVFSDYVIVN